MGTVVTCGCGRAYDLAAWRALGVPSYQGSGLAGVELELSRCACGSHRAIHVTAAERREYLDDAAVAQIEHRKERT